MKVLYLKVRQIIQQPTTKQSEKRKEKSIIIGDNSRTKRQFNTETL